jgi:uncharacterized spore protein YtfJ
MKDSNDKIKVNAGFSKDLNKDGLGVTIQALFKGMESLVQSKTVVGEPIEAGGALIIPLIEISAGLASGALMNSAKNNGAGAMSAKMSPVALLIIEDGKTKLVSVKNQDVFTRLLDLIPEAVDKVRKGAVTEEVRKQADELARTIPDGDIEVIEPEEAENI